MEPAVIKVLISTAGLFVGFVLAMSAHLWLPRLFRAILKRMPLAPAKNTVVGDTPDQRVREFICRIDGCITVGSYYGMAQATCRRCGHKNSCAGTHVPEWRDPTLE